MARRARWIRLGCVDARELQAACGGFTAARAREAAPIVLWACAADRKYWYVVIAPARVAPGKSVRWIPWALTPAVAAYRDFGARTYLDGTDICLHGRPIGCGRVEALGECLVITSLLDAIVSSPESSPGAPAFRTWLREGLGLAMTQWGGESDAPPERAFEAALRARIEAQHGWQFESSWPDEGERRAIEAARLPACV
jgi:hypothetical protein